MIAEWLILWKRLVPSLPLSNKDVRKLLYF